MCEISWGEIYLGELEREKKAHYPNSRNWKELSLRFLLGIKRAFEDDLEKKRAFSSVLELLSFVVLLTLFRASSKVFKEKNLSGRGGVERERDNNKSIKY